MAWRSRKALVAGLSGSILLTGSVWAEVRSMPSSVERLVRDYMNHTPVSAIAPNGTLEQAAQFQQQFVQALIPQLGPIVGYKAALTSPVAQERFGVSHPLRGTLLKEMLLSSGATVPVNFGARGVFEADLMVRVGDAKINQAKTPQEVLESLDAVIPFIELPDLMYDRTVTLNGPALVAINTGARLGVLGEPVALEGTPEWEKRLGSIAVVMENGKGETLSEGSSSALLGHPLQAVLWLKEDLRAAGIDLKPGDLLSLGTITPLTPVKEAMIIRARYEGLGEVSVTFE
ncbi:hydratase [Roseofilum reptotaenium AO1-A]|uniref:Hydratase n=1 Tax=Roseofilum reptotaenium AO1-A TaxID=1925591 RepID=A0A1L9QUP4_9CYAN|nr:hydratase [Roseofilum reptotaenium AO1-A]